MEDGPIAQVDGDKGGHQHHCNSRQPTLHSDSAFREQVLSLVIRSMAKGNACQLPVARLT
jgi:hypothetical protein